MWLKAKRSISSGTTENDSNPYRYAGEYFDKETGTIYLRARYYSPVNGRFTAKDPHWNVNNMIYGDPLEDNPNIRVPDYLAIRQSANLYGYCLNSPMKYCDSDGGSVTVSGAVGACIAICIVDGAITGGVYAFKGERFTAGFINGFLSCLVTEAGIAIGSITGTPAGVYAGTIIGSTIGSAVGTLVEDLIYNKDKSATDIAKSAAQSAASGIVSGVGAAYLKYAIDIANEAESAAKLLMEYDEEFGDALQVFFGELATILGSQ